MDNSRKVYILEKFAALSFEGFQSEAAAKAKKLLARAKAGDVSAVKELQKLKELASSGKAFGRKAGSTASRGAAKVPEALLAALGKSVPKGRGMGGMGAPGGGRGLVRAARNKALASGLSKSKLLGVLSKAKGLASKNKGLLALAAAGGAGAMLMGGGDDD